MYNMMFPCKKKTTPHVYMYFIACFAGINFFGKNLHPSKLLDLLKSTTQQKNHHQVIQSDLFIP